MAKRKRKRIQPVRGTVVNHNPDWEIHEVGVGAPARRAVGAATMDIPAYLTTGPLRPARRLEARQQTARRGVGAPAPVTFSMEAPSDERFVSVARHESGALTFHLPVAPAGAAQRGVARAGATQTLVFTIPPGVSQTLGIGDARRGIISKIIKIIVLKVANAVAKAALPILARKLEEREWQKKVLGWVRVTREGLINNSLRADVPAFKPTDRGLLLIHGTFSSTSAFRGLANDFMFDGLTALYDDRIFGFNHFSYSKSPEENAREMLAQLPAGRQTFDVVTHSRGGLVLRSLLQQPGVANKINFGSIILVASPNQGTPLATPLRWEETLGWFANLLEIFPENPFTTAASWIAEGLSWLAQHVTGDLPGLNSMDMNGDVVRDLEMTSLPDNGDEWFSLVSNYRPPDEKLLARLADMGVDAFFQTANDLVVPTAGGWELGKDRAAFVPGDHIGCFGPGGNLSAGPISHVQFFGQRESQELILHALSGEALGVGSIETTAEVPRRSVKQIVGGGGGAEEVAITPRADALSEQRATSAAVPAPAPAPISAAVSYEDALRITILPASIDPGNKEKERQTVLLATYGSARVLVHFGLSGKEDGRRWYEVIQREKRIAKYIEKGIGPSPTREELVEYGTRLFDILFGGEIRRLYDQARHRSRFRRLTVIFTSAVPWVANFPWELAYDPGCGSFITVSDVRFIRNVISPVDADIIPVTAGPLRILLVWAQPTDQVKLSTAQEEAEVMKSFKPLIDAGAIKVDVLPQATVQTLHAWVRQRQYDVLHFIGHGVFQPEDALGGTGYLLFEDEQRNSDRLATAQLKNILRGRGIRLVFLNACQTATGGRADYNQGVAPGLVNDGVPAVVANQYPVFDRSAMLFAKHFYWCLAQGLSVGDAARESRIAMDYSGVGALDWAVPCLFARNPDARLCEGVIRSDVPVGPPGDLATEAKAIKEKKPKPARAPTGRKAGV